jgi:hypothetical protein
MRAHCKHARWSGKWPIRSLAVAVAFAAAFAIPATASSPLHSFYLVKDCTDFFSGGNTCKVTVSPDPAIPVGSVIAYNGPVFNDAGVLSMRVVINAPGGTATGHCTWPMAVRPAGTCTFAQGTGSLSGFHANASVTPGGGALFVLVGTYQL